MAPPTGDTQGRSDRLSPEDRLLLRCAGIHEDDLTGESTAEIIGSSLDWDGLIRKSLRHGVASLLHAYLDGLDTQQRIPARISHRLKSIYYASAMRAVRAEQQVTDILAGLGGLGIDAILLKGLFLAKTLYQNVALRPVGDIDLLIRYRDIRPVDALLRQLGFGLAPGSLPLTYYLKVHFHVTYLNPSKPGSIPLEIHWGVQDDFNIPKINADEMWSRARPWTIGSCETLALHPEDLIIYLCYHADKHTCFSRYVDDWAEVGPGIVLANTASAELLWYADIRRFIHRCAGGLDWSRLTDTCRRWGVDGSVYASLAVTRSLFGVSAADAAIDRLDPPRPGKLKAALYRRLMPPDQPGGADRQSITGTARRRLLDSGFALQFRPIRLLDIWDYLLPDPGRLSHPGPTISPLFWGRYLRHVITASLRVVSSMGLLVGCSIRRWVGTHPVERS
jgi:hypothetical protein